VRNSDAERGTAAVEFALVLPILLVIALAMVQVGIVVRDEMMVVQASRAGAREAAVTSDPSAVRAAIERGGVGLDGSSLRIAIDRTGTEGDAVQVDVEYAEAIRVPFVAWLFPGTVMLRASAVARQEFA
jgi:Flp pilus assembly pilin Flp